MKQAALLAILVLVAANATAQTAQPTRNMGGGKCASNPYNCADAPNPLVRRIRSGWKR